jgi:hypothetical protein
VQLFGNKDIDNGLAAISIDGRGKSFTDLHSSNAQDNALIYRSGNPGDGFHTIKARASGQKNAGSIGSTIDLGKLEVS